MATVGINCSSGGNDGLGEKLCCIHGGSPFADGGRLFGEGVYLPDRGVKFGRTDVRDWDLGRGRVAYFGFVGECREGVVGLSSNDSLRTRFRLYEVSMRSFNCAEGDR